MKDLDDLVEKRLRKRLAHSPREERWESINDERSFYKTRGALCRSVATSRAMSRPNDDVDLIETA